MVATDTDALWVVCWSIDRDGGCSRIEPHWRLITGRAAETALGGGWRDAIHPEDRDRVEAELTQAARSARHFQIVFRLARAGGGHSFAMAVGSPQRAADGGLVGYDGSIVDLHDRVTAEQERDSEQRFRSLFETCRDGIVTVDMAGRILDANPAYRTMLGYTLAELQSLTYQELTPPQWRAMEEAIVRDQILRRGESAEYEKEYIRKDGAVFPISLRTWTVLDERGRVVGMRAFIRDITERKRAEAALRASERRFRAIFDQQFQYSALLSADSRVVEINQAIVRETGVTQEEVAGKPFLDGPWWRELPEMRARWRRQLDEALSRPGPSLGEGVYHVPSGELRYAINTATALRDEQGEIELLLVQGMDITERKQAEAALRESEERFRVSFANASIGFAMNGPDFAFLDANPAYCAITGYSREELLALGGSDLIHPDDWPADRAFAERMLAGETPGFVIENRYVRKTGEAIFVRKSISLIRRADGAPAWIITLVEDITERRRAEEALRQSGNDLDRAQEVGKIGWWRLDVRRNVLTWSEENYRIFGVPKGTPLSYESFLALVHPDDRAYVDAQWQAGMRGAPYDIEHRIMVGGKINWVREKAYLELDAEGALLGGFGVTQDITERKEAEAALRDSELRFRALALASSDAVYRMSPDWSELRHLAGRDFIADTVEPSRSWLHTYILPDDQPRVTAAIAAAVAERRLFELEHRVIRIDGGVGWTHSRAVPILDSSREIVEWFGVARDITERKRSEEALLWHMRRNELLSETAAQLLASEDPQRMAEEVCRKVMSFLDCDLFFNFIVDEDVGRLRLNACAGVSDEQASVLEWLDIGAAVCGFVASRGERLIVEDVQNLGDLRTEHVRSLGVEAYCCHPLLHQDRVIGTLSFGTRSRARFDVDEIAVMKAVADLTAIAMRRVQTERELRDSDRRKDEFIATLAHELRNPLAPIRNAVHILLRKYGAQFADAPLLAMVQRQVDHLVRLVDDLLEISRISRGKVDLRKENVTVSDILRHALETSQPLVEKKGHRLVVTLAEEPLRVLGDPVRLAQIAANIINNAAKYTPPGGRIEVEAAREGEEAVLRVRDNGVGITAEMMPHVFDLFAQTHDQTRLSEGGLGIGLALVRKLLEMHGGRVEARSAGAGRGSEFVVRLPIAERPPALRAGDAPAQEDASKGARALIVDDDRDVADSFGLLLETLGASVRKVYDGAAGVAAVDAFEPDLVFVDIGMPGVDGYETARRMRATAHRHPFLLVALTGWGQEADRRRAQEAGFDLHLTKPAAIDAVEELMRRVGAA
jgi:PAS domain S-box-containing protein